MSKTRWPEKWVTEKTPMGVNEFEKLYMGNFKPCSNFSKTTGVCTSRFDKNGDCECGQINQNRPPPAGQ